MSSEVSIGAFLAARHVLEEVNLNLLEWTSETWSTWLQTQRSPELSRIPRLVVVARLTALEDIPLHVGLMQLLAVPRLDCAVILEFPTEDMACLARTRARREGWHELVRIVAPSEMARTIANLSVDTLLAVFGAPSVLEREAIAAILAQFSELPGPPRKIATTQLENFFFGRVEDFANWSGLLRSPAGLVDSIAVIIAQDVERIVVPRGIASTAWMTEFTTAGLMHTVEPFESGLRVPTPGNDGELVVTIISDTDENIVVVRQNGRLLDRNEQLHIRLPASLSTVTPQKLRLECRDAGERVASRDFLFHVPPSRLEPWMLSAFLNRGGGGNAVIRAFAQGVECRIAYAEDEPEELQDVPVVWGVLRQSDRILAQAKRQNLYFFYIDHAYFNRGHGNSYRITRNRYEAGPVRKCPEDRIVKLDVEVRPWQKGGREIIVCPPTDYFIQAHDCADWLDETITTLRRVTDRPITIRTKPSAGEQVVSLASALKKAHALVTHSSNVAIEAACLGTPVFVDAASAAAPIGLTDLSQIETPAYPDREHWLAHLAYNQFSLEEIGDGRAWQMLLELEQRDYA